MKVSDDIKLRADMMARLAESVRLIEAEGPGIYNRWLIHLLIVTYSGLTSRQCSYISGYKDPHSGAKAAKSAEELIERDWDYKRLWEAAVKIVHNPDKNHKI